MRTIVFLIGFLTSVWGGVLYAQSSLQNQLETGIAQMRAQDYGNAYQTLIDGERAAEIVDSTHLQVLFNNNIGAMYYYLSQYDSAMFYYNKAFQVAEYNNLLSLQNTVLNNMGIVYSSQGFDHKASECINKALAISVLENDSNKIAINHANLAQINVNLNELLEAQIHAQIAINKFGEVLDSLTYFSSLNTLGKVQGELGNYDSALVLANQCVEVSNQFENVSWLTTSLLLKGSLLSASHDYLGAKTSLKKALQLTENTQIDQQVEVLHELIGVYEAMRIWDSANVYLHQLVALKDSNEARKNAGFINQTVLQFDLYMEQQKLAITNSKNQQRIFYTRIILAVLFLLIVLLILLLIQRKKVNMLRQQQLRNEKQLITKQRDEAQEKSMHLEEQLTSINYELMSKSLLIDNKNAVLQAVGELVKESDLSIESNYINDLKQQLNRDKIVDQNHEDFSVYFERVHATFFKNLHQTHKGLTAADLRLAAFFLLQLNTKEIANILNVSPDTVRKRKQRLRQKLGLKSGVDVQGYLLSIA